MLDKFDQQVDPDGTLTPAERAKRSEHARKAHFKRLALKSAQARRRRAGGAEPPGLLADVRTGGTMSPSKSDLGGDAS